MVKKIDGKGGRLTGPVESTRPVSTEKVGTTKGVGATKEGSRAKRARRPTRPMTAAEREHLFNLIHEEADKMFGPNGLPESQRHTVESAVKMAIDASIVEEEDEENSSND